MIGEVLKVGDEVTITIGQENRDWGYNPCPDGTKAIVTAFSEIPYGRTSNCGAPKPGIYVNHSWVDLILEDGKPHHEWTGRLEMTNKKEYEKRVAEWRENYKKSGNLNSYVFIRDLPETPYWEGDYVNVYDEFGVPRKCVGDSTKFMVISIDYKWVNNTDYYRVSEKFTSGWHSYVNANHMDLIERGQVWKYYHNGKLVFANLEEEANFFKMIGHTKEVRNPANGLYKWELNEVLDAIKNGIAHGFNCSDGLFGGGPYISALKFNDEKLGKRVAKATIKGFPGHEKVGS